MSKPNNGNCPSCGKTHCMVLVKTREENNGKELWRCNYCGFEISD